MNMPIDRAQDPWAQGLLELNARWLRAYFIASCGNATLADDLVQEVFMAALESADRYDSSRNFAGWLRGIARNILLNHFRDQKHKVLSLNNEVLDQIEHCAARAQEAHVQPDYADTRMEALRGCLAVLSTRARQAIELKYFEQLASRKIASKIGMAETAVNVLISRARKSLEDCIAMKSEGAES